MGKLLLNYMSHMKITSKSYYFGFFKNHISLRKLKYT